MRAYSHAATRERNRKTEGILARMSVVHVVHHPSDPICDPKSPHMLRGLVNSVARRLDGHFFEILKNIEFRLRINGLAFIFIEKHRFMIKTDQKSIFISLYIKF
jgi:hypothetical protein